MSRCISFPVALTVLALSWAAPLRADDARAAYERGMTAFDGERYVEAADAFRAAYALKPSWKILFNLGQSEAAAKRYGLALEAFEDYLAAAGDELSPERREMVLAEVERLRKMVGYLAIDAPDGAVVSVDGMVRGTAPFSGEVPVSIGGGHEISAELGGRSLGTRKVKVFGGKSVSVSFTAGAASDDHAVSGDPGAGEQPDAPTPPAPTAAGDGGLELAGWIGVGTGGALLLAALVTGTWALSIDDDLAATCNDGSCPPTERDQVDRMEALGIATDVLIGVGAAAAAVGAALLVYTKVASEEKPSGATADISAGPAFAPGFLGASASVRFQR